MALIRRLLLLERPCWHIMWSADSSNSSSPAQKKIRISCIRAAVYYNQWTEINRLTWGVILAALIPKACESWLRSLVVACILDWGRYYYFCCCYDCYLLIYLEMRLLYSLRRFWRTVVTCLRFSDSSLICLERSWDEVIVGINSSWAVLTVGVKDGIVFSLLWWWPVALSETL